MHTQHTGGWATVEGEISLLKSENKNRNYRSVGALASPRLPYGLTTPDLALCRKVTTIYVMCKPCTAIRTTTQLKPGYLRVFQCRHQSPWISGDSCRSELAGRAWILHIYIFQVISHHAQCSWFLYQLTLLL